MALATVRGWALAALALLAPGPAERGRPYAVLQKQNLGKSRRPVASTFLLGVFISFRYRFLQSWRGGAPGGCAQLLTCLLLLPLRSAAGQHPQRAPAHHHPHGRLRLQAGPAAVAERAAAAPPWGSAARPARFCRLAPAVAPPRRGMPRGRARGSAAHGSGVMPRSTAARPAAGDDAPALGTPAVPAALPQQPRLMCRRLPESLPRVCAPSRGRLRAARPATAPVPVGEPMLGLGRGTRAGCERRCLPSGSLRSPAPHRVECGSPSCSPERWLWGSAVQPSRRVRRGKLSIPPRLHGAAECVSLSTDTEA